MKTETCDTYDSGRAKGLLLLTNPWKYFSALPREENGAWRYLLIISMAAAVMNFFAGATSGNLAGLVVFFVNAVGMAYIFAGCVFLFARIFFGRACSSRFVFSICAYASLGPILISWIPGAMWVAEPWRWWASAVGLGVWTGAGTGKAAMAVGLGVAAMYVLIQALLFIV